MLFIKLPGGKVEGIPAILKYKSVGSVDGLNLDGLDQVYVQIPAKYETWPGLLSQIAANWKSQTERYLRPRAA